MTESRILALCSALPQFKQDSKELSPRSLDKMLLKLQVNSQNVQNTQLLQFIWFSNISEHVQTCLNLFRFNMIQIVTIHTTCLNMMKHVLTCLESIWYELKWFSNTSEHVQTCLNLFKFNMIRIVTIQYDTNCYDSYDSQTCPNLFRFNRIWIVMIQYDSQTCLNLS